jgi:hypothetical protein
MPVDSITFALILSRICLLTLPISDLRGLIKRQGRVIFKIIGLWSFNVIKGSLSAVVLIRSVKFNMFAMDFDRFSIDETVCVEIF